MEEKEIKEKKEAWEFPLETRTGGWKRGPNETKQEREREKKLFETRTRNNKSNFPDMDPPSI